MSDGAVRRNNDWDERSDYSGNVGARSSVYVCRHIVRNEIDEQKDQTGWCREVRLAQK